MEQKYLVSLSGKILKDSMEETVESLSSIFLEKQPSDIESLIQNKATIKRGVDLSLANKIKSRMEQAGVECVIALDSQIVSPQQDKQPIEESLNTPEASIGGTYKAEGATYISIAIISTFILFLISDGYDPNAGILWSLTNNMWLYSGYPFCDETPPYRYSCIGEFTLNIPTKYVLIAFVALLAYGIGRYKNYFHSIGHYVKKIRKIFE
ncbi:TPA: hypothetical protein ACG3CW_004420 [Pseudomonas aeruginosa]